MDECNSVVISVIDTPKLGPPPGYSNVIVVNSSRLVFIAGQAAYDDVGNIIGVGDFAAQVKQVFLNLKIALEAAECSIANLVKMTVFLRDIQDLLTYRQARDKFLSSVSPQSQPAVTLVEVSRLYSDELLIEIEAVAAI